MSRMVRLHLCALLAAVAVAQTPVLRQGISVQMPVTVNAVTMPDADMAGSLIVSVTRSGAVYLEVTRVPPAQLSEALKADLLGHPEKKVYLKGDARAPYPTVAEVLSALKTAGVDARILTNQHDPVDTSYIPPAGLEVLLQPPASDAAQATTLRVGNGQLSDAELRQRAQRDRSVVLRMDEAVPFDDVVHVVDVCRGTGAKVYLAAAGK
jgi:biopolymer transport protein ExbD